jgi:chemotaxis protein methyltransferase CheR
MYIAKLSEHDEKQFQMLKRKIFNDTSLDLHQYKNNYLRRRIDVRMRARSAKSYYEYYRLLTVDPSEYDNLLKDLTINVTHFYRDPEVYRIIEDEVLPLMIYNNVKKQRRNIRVLSVGCSSGEEVYSMAILLHELLGEEFNNFHVSINGIDIDDTSLNIAKQGKYPQQQIENIKDEYLDRYFSFDGEMYQISEEIRGMVKFKNLDIFKGKLGAHYNVIICRNVMIYFTKEMQDKLFMQFYDALINGGYLIIGKTETLVGDAKDKFIITNSRERIYQKLEKSNREYTML